MAYILWSQDFFARGELSPFVYSRVTLDAYYQGLKRAKNVICFPQGSAGKRFGTVFLNEITETNNFVEVYFKAFPFLNEAVYILTFVPDKVFIYLEGALLAIVTGTGIAADEIRLIDSTILENRFRITTGIFPPKDLIRTANAANAITGFSAVNDTLTLTNAVTAGNFWPARFVTGGAFPASTPQIIASRTYFVRAITANTVRVYNTVFDAAANLNFFQITSAGVLTDLLVLNTWALNNVVFRNLPVFDFTGGFDSSAFTPAAAVGFGIVITRTAGAFNFEARYVGGVFAGNGGIARIIATNGTTTATVDIVVPFISVAAIPGVQSFIAEPAWSTARGWPRKCSSFQNRAFFANTDLLSNGLWGSVTNDFDDFDDIETNDDNAISWFPTSDTVNFIQFIVPYRSLTIHTNTGIYSTPLSIDTAITPKNFSLSLQDTHPADFVKPAAIDNQIITLAGNDAYSFVWDGINNAYSSGIISIVNEQLIRLPIDEAPYADLIRAGSRYMFIINDAGNMAVYQTLINENVTGFTEAVVEQSYGDAFFCWVTSSFDGRAWFVIERQIAVAGVNSAITSNTANTLSTAALTFTVGQLEAVVFSGGLPVSSPQLDNDRFYFLVGTGGGGGAQFKVFDNEEDALADENFITFTNFGVGAFAQVFPLETKLFIEQLDFDAKVDCAGFRLDEAGFTSVTSVPRFNAQEVQMQGNGFGFETIGVNDAIEFISHGNPAVVTDVQFGFPIDVEITPMPISISMNGNAKSSNLMTPKHVRFATCLFHETIGGTIIQGNNEFPIVLTTLEQIFPGDPPDARTGGFQFAVFNAWDDYRSDNFTINHRAPFDIVLTGIFYTVEA